MPVRFRQSDLFLIPVVGGVAAIGHVNLKMQGGNILAVIYSGRSEIDGNIDLDAWLSSSRPDFTVDTMDLFIKNGAWRVLGNWHPPVAPHPPVYKTQFEFGGLFYGQRIDGSIGGRLTDDEASLLRRPKSYSPALVEKAVRALQGLEPWLPVFDEMRPDGPV